MGNASATEILAGSRCEVGSASDSKARDPGFDIWLVHNFVSASADSRRAVVSYWI